MAEGLQCWDATGALLVDNTTRIARILGIIAPTASGSMTVPEFATGIAFARPLTSTSSKTPQVYIAGTTLSWVGSQTIVYGVW